MKYLVIYFYLAQVCAAPGSAISAPPYYYMGVYDTLQEAVDYENTKNPKEVKSIIIYGYPDFLSSYDAEKMKSIEVNK